MAAKLNENTEVALPLRNIISMVAAASLATWAYFGIIERLNQIETNITMMESDLGQNTEFRIKWLTAQIDEGRAPHDQQQKLTLEFYEKRISAIEARLEIMRNGKDGD
jgi:hypothetical protein